MNNTGKLVEVEKKQHEIIIKNMGAAPSFDQMAERDKEIKSQEFKANTTETYTKVAKKVNAICQALGTNTVFVDMDTGEIITPISPNVLMGMINFLTFCQFKSHKNTDTGKYEMILIDTPSKFSTIESFVSGVVKKHIDNGYENPKNNDVKKYLKNTKEKLNDQEEQATPLMLSRLLGLVQDLNLLIAECKNVEDYNNPALMQLLTKKYTNNKTGITTMIPSNRKSIFIRDKAILLMGFWGCLRRSEIITLERQKTNKETRGYLEMKNKMLYVNILKTKNHYSGDSIQKTIKKLEPEYAAICPVHAVHAWMALSKDCKSKVFTQIKSGGKIQCDKELTGKTVDRMVRNYFTLNTEEIAEKVKPYSGHSLRVGYCVSQFDAGATLEDIRLMGGWKSDVMPIRYTKERDLAKRPILDTLDASIKDYMAEN